MLMTLAYLYMYFVQRRQKRNLEMSKCQLLSAIRKCLRLSTIHLHRFCLPRISESLIDSASGSCSLDCCPGLHLAAAKDTGNVEVLFETSDCNVCAIVPKCKVSLDGWTRYLANESQLDVGNVDLGSSDAIYVALELLKNNCCDSHRGVQNPLPITRLEDLVQLIAWRSGHPFQVVARCTESDFTALTQAFINNTLVTEEMLQVNSVTSVNIQGSPDELILRKSPVRCVSSPLVKSPLRSTQAAPLKPPLRSFHSSAVETSLGSCKPSPPDPKNSPVKHPFPSTWNSTSEVPVACHLPENPPAAGPYPPGYNNSYAVEFIRAEELPETYSDSECAGEAPAEPLEDLAPEMLTPISRKTNLRGKPPNILIYCGKKDSLRLFENVRSVFSQCLNTDRYTIYHLKHDQVKTTPWVDNAVLLVISSERVYDGVDEVFLRFFLGGGSVVSFASHFDSKFVARVQTNSKSSILGLCYEHWTDATFICGRHVYEQSLRSLLYDVTLTAVATEKQKGNPVIVEAVHEASGGVALLSQVSLDKDPSEMAISLEIFTILKQSNIVRFEILRSLFRRLGVDCELPQMPPLTPIVLLTTSSKNKQIFLQSLEPRLKDGQQLVSKDLTLWFTDDGSDPSGSSSVVSTTTIPVITNPDRLSTLFDFAAYEANLGTKVLGNVMLYSDVISTTMNLFEGLMFTVSAETGLIAVARRQTAGQGRGGNAWLSPPGCAMFSMHVRIPVTSWLGERIPYLQHLVALAVVLAVRQKTGYEDVDVRVKWPNDVYFGANMKLGGILVKSSMMHNSIHANIGCGVNVSNRDPTICINDLIQNINENDRKAEGERLRLLTMEEVIARTVTSLEELIEKFQLDGPQDFQKLYYKYWLHGNQSIRLESENGPEATVVGLDDYGYLLVRLTSGQLHSVQPDGNSFDMMRNLIAPKAT